MFKENIMMSLENIVHNKMRVFLTVLGVIIGVTSVISLITIVEGATSDIVEQFEELGVSQLNVQIFGTPAKDSLSPQDLLDIENIENVDVVSITTSTTGTAIFEEYLMEDLPVIGKDYTSFQQYEDDLIGGRTINKIDVANKTHVANITKEVEQQLFRGKSGIDKTIFINGISFKVVGILDDGRSSEEIYIPYNTVMHLNGGNRIDSIEVFMDDTSKGKQITADLEKILDRIFQNAENSYYIFDIADLLEQLDEITGVMTAMLTGIASISLVVGGIGIMNMMLVSVSERRSEIGLRKALGAKKSDIQILFALEAIIISIIGGIIGMILGNLLAYLAAVGLSIPFKISVGGTILGTIFSITVGIIFGWSPARKASKQNAVDCLRDS